MIINFIKLNSLIFAFKYLMIIFAGLKKIHQI
jgi:hypothetical protein